MQIFGVRENFSFGDGSSKAITPLASRIFTKLETSLWDSGSTIMPLLPDLTGEIEIVARVDDSVNTPISVEEASQLQISYALGIDFGSGERGTEDGQWWRSKGARGYAPISQFAPKHKDDGMKAMRQHMVKVDIKGKKHIKASFSLDSIQHTVPEIISLLSEHCSLAPGDLIFLGALHFIQDFTEPVYIVATCADLPPLQLYSRPELDGHIRLTMGEHA